VIDETAARVDSAAHGGSRATILLCRAEAAESAARQLFGVIDAVFCKFHYPCHDQVDVGWVRGIDDFPHLFEGRVHVRGELGNDLFSAQRHDPLSLHGAQRLRSFVIFGGYAESLEVIKKTPYRK
jgi:hypothetical protein